MINVSDAFISRMAVSRDFRCRAEVTLGDGAKLTLGDGELDGADNMFRDGAGIDGLPLGAALSRSVELGVVNDGGRYDSVDFIGASVIVWLDYDIDDDGGRESVPVGTFTVTGTETRGGVIIVTAQDAMWRADNIFSTSLKFPVTAGELFRDICINCGIPFSTSAFANSTFVIDAPPAGEYTFREMLGFIAMLAGGNARVNRAGQCEIISYGAAADETAVARGFDDWISLSSETEDIAVTGVSIPLSDGTTYLCGEEGYVIPLSSPLFAGRERTAADLIGSVLRGLRFRRFEGEVFAYPLAEFMDKISVTDASGRTFETFLTDVVFNFFGKTVLCCSVRPPADTSATFISVGQRALTEARRLVAEERTARETATAELAAKIAESGGMYSTEERQPDGSTIFYLHDKPTLAESKNVIRVGSEAVGFSTDGGASYPYGITVDGDLIARILSAEGVSADWIDAGSLVARDGGGNVVFSVNVETGEVVISGDHVMIGGRSATDAVAGAEASAANAEKTASDAAQSAANAEKTAAEALEAAKKSSYLTVILSNEFEAVPTDADGNYPPDARPATTASALFGQTDVSDACAFTAAPSPGVTGVWNDALRTYTVTMLDGEDGFVDITARYLTMTATRRFSVAKVRGGARGEPGKDAVLLVIDSSNGVIFKNSSVATVLSVTVIMGDSSVSCARELHNVFGEGAKLVWLQKRRGETEFTELLPDDERLSDEGFLLAVSAGDVDVKTIFACELRY